MDEMCKVNLNDQPSWALRCKWIEQFSKLIENEYKGSAIPNEEDIYDRFSRILPFLKSQFTSRQSALIKLAGDMLITFINTLKDSSRKFINDLLSIIFSQLYITIKVISDTSKSIINSVIENCKSLDILPIILEKCKERKSALLHEKCSEFVHYYLKVNKSIDISKFNECLNYMLNDNDSKCRSEAKLTYELYKEINPVECNKFYDTLSSDIQKRLNEKKIVNKSSISSIKSQMIKNMKRKSKTLDEIEIVISKPSSESKTSHEDSKMSEMKESKSNLEEGKENRKNFQASIVSIPQDDTSCEKVKRQRDVNNTFDEERLSKRIHLQ